MMVKDESKVIRRCLESVRDWIDYWVICDTGSKDDTKGIVRDVLRGIPGQLHERPWVDFGHNRTQTLGLAQGKADYHLVLDADMTVGVTGEFRGYLDADQYFLRFEGDCEYYLPLLVRDGHEWRYHGVTHEYVHSPTAQTKEKLRALSIHHHCDGWNRAGKFQRDIDLLTKALASEPDNPRYMFYLGQSYRDLGMGYQALEWFLKRAMIGGWDEEVWYSLYQVARLKHASAMAWPGVMETYLSAYELRPWRLEPLLPVARHYRQAGQFHLGLMFSRPIMETPYPDDVLFIERNVYAYELPLEYAACCSGLGLHQEAERVHQSIHATPATSDIPPGSWPSLPS